MSPATPPASRKAPSINLPRVAAVCMTAEDAPRSLRIGPNERLVTAALTSLERLTSTHAAKSHQPCPSRVVVPDFASAALVLIATRPSTTTRFAFPGSRTPAREDDDDRDTQHSSLPGFGFSDRRLPAVPFSQSQVLCAVFRRLAGIEDPGNRGRRSQPRRQQPA
jgi:HPt (histidine-containing phosphotransfer) domain-containing protein